MAPRAMAGQEGAPDPAAFTALAERYQEMAFGYALATLHDFHLAQDVTQESLYIAYCNLATLRDARAFPAWLRGIVRHQCGRVLRRRHLDLVPLDDGIGVPALSMSPERYLEQQELLRQVSTAIVTLPRAEQEVTTLFYMKDYSQREVAAFLELPVTTVNNRLHAARRRLKERLVAMVQTIGTVQQARGPVVDVYFEPEELPRVLSALALRDESRAGGVPLQVVQLLDSRTARCVALDPLDEVKPGTAVTLADGPAGVPLSAALLERAMPYLGTPHAGGVAPTAPALLETGIKVIDLLCPYPKGGKVGFFGPSGAGKMVVTAEVLRNVAADETGLAVMAFIHGQAEGLGWHTSPDEVPRPAGAGQLLRLPIEDSIDVAAPAAHAASALLDAATYLSRDIGASGIWPAVDPLLSTSRLLDPAIVGQEHYEVAHGVRRLLRRYRELQESAAGSHLTRLSPAEALVVARARKVRWFCSQPFVVAEPFTQRPGQYVPPTETVRGFKALLDGQYDHLPEQALQWCGAIEQAVEKGRAMRA